MILPNAPSNLAFKIQGILKKWNSFVLTQMSKIYASKSNCNFGILF